VGGNMKKLLTLLLVLIACSVSAIDMGPYDTGAARKSDLDLKLNLDGTNAPTTIQLINASFSGDIDVAGNVGAATVNGVAPLTAASQSQALVGLATIDLAAKNIVSSGNTETAYSGRGVVSSSKIQLRSEYSETAATYTVGVFTSAGGNEKFTYLGKMLVKGLAGSEEYTVLLEAGSNAENTAVAVTTGPTVTASALVGTPADIVASYSVTGAALTLTVHVPQTYHTINMTNQFVDTGTTYCNWSD
jgi:hypothetical protein